MTGSYVLPLVLALPLLGAIFVMCTPKEEHGLHRGIGLVFSLASFFVSLLLLAYFHAPHDATATTPADPGIAGFQEVFDVAWIPGLEAHFKVGIDGISLWLVILTTFLTPLTLFASAKAIDRHVREFTAAFLVLEVGMIGAFVAIDLFLFYVMWEVMLIPMYLLIGIWGGQRRLYASIKFVIYTMVGSLCMLAAILYVYTQYASVTGVYTTDLEQLQGLVLPHNAQIWCFAAFALAFAIKVPLFPLHTWLPDAHVEAPTAGSVILAGVLLKFGIYGFLRFAIPLFPYGAHAASPYILALAVIGIVYGALVAFAQDDVKKLVAYSSVSHLGFCALGVFAMTAQGIEGSIYAMLSHGLTTGGLFLGIGVLYERRHTRRLAEYGGIWKQMPVFAGLYLIVTMGSAGLPGLSGFVGEFLCLFGTFNSDAIPHAHVWGAIAATGVILGAVYLLFMFQKVFFGPLDKAKNGKLPDLSGRELTTFTILAVSIVALGFASKPILKTMEPSVESLLVKQANKLGTAHDGEYADTPVPYVLGQPPPSGAPIQAEADDVAHRAQQVANVIQPAAAGGAP
jgi:NADH-quinone oxidoreductase subunit M